MFKKIGSFLATPFRAGMEWADKNPSGGQLRRLCVQVEALEAAGKLRLVVKTPAQEKPVFHTFEANTPEGLVNETLALVATARRSKLKVVNAAFKKDAAVEAKAKAAAAKAREEALAAVKPANGILDVLGSQDPTARDMVG